MNFFQQGIPLGRWFGITVVLHWTFLFYAAFELFGGGHTSALELQIQALEIALLFGTVLIHEFGHALSCKAMGGVAIHIVLWPLGGIAFIQPPGNAWAWLVTTVCGPLVNAVLWPVFWFLSFRLGITSDRGLMLYLSTHAGLQFYGALSCYFLWQINKLLLLFNLIPSYPMDGGRVLQEILWLTIGYQKSLQIAGMVGVVAGAGFVVLGLGLTEVTIPILNLHLGGKGGNDWMLIAIGILCAMQSWNIYQRSLQMKSQMKSGPNP